MKQPPTISFRDIDASDAVEQKIRQRIERLERYAQEIISCRVVVETPHRQHKKGKIYKTSIELSVPGSKIVVNRNPEDDHSHEDIYVSLRDAFDAAERQLKEYSERRRGDVKRSADPPEGHVDRLFPDDGYGFIDPNTGGEHIYFHQNAIIDGDFDGLDVGQPVRYVVEEGDEGPQASSVHLLNPQESLPGQS